MSQRQPLPKPELSDLWIQHQRRNNKTTPAWACVLCPERKIFASKYAIWSHAQVDHLERFPSGDEELQEFRSNFEAECAYNRTSRPLSNRSPGNSALYARAIDYKRKAVRLLIKGETCFARPDSGADRNTITATFAEENGVEFKSSEDDTDTFVMGNGQYTSSIGKAFIPCKLLGDESDQSCWFHVLAKCPVPIILGREFLRKIGLYTKNQHLLVDYPLSFGDIPALVWVGPGPPKGEIKLSADGHLLEACADTGSDLDLMSLDCAQKKDFKIDRSKRSRVMLADETVVETVGQVHVTSIQLPGFDESKRTRVIPAAKNVVQTSVETVGNNRDPKEAESVENLFVFHVLANLVCDVVLCEEFLEQMDAFNTCEMTDLDDPRNQYSLKPFINLGPVQSLLADKIINTKIDKNLQRRHSLWSPMQPHSTPQGTSHQDHEAQLEEEMYQRHQASRNLAKEKDQGRAQVLMRNEAARRVNFVNKHKGCTECIGNLTTSVLGEGQEDGTTDTMQSLRTS